MLLVGNRRSVQPTITLHHQLTKVHFFVRPAPTWCNSGAVDGSVPFSEHLRNRLKTASFWKSREIVMLILAELNYVNKICVTHSHMLCRRLDLT